MSETINVSPQTTSTQPPAPPLLPQESETQKKSPAIPWWLILLLVVVGALGAYLGIFTIPRRPSGSPEFIGMFLAMIVGRMLIFPFIIYGLSSLFLKRVRNSKSFCWVILLVWSFGCITAIPALDQRIKENKELAEVRTVVANQINLFEDAAKTDDIRESAQRVKDAQAAAANSPVFAGVAKMEEYNEIFRRQAEYLETMASILQQPGIDWFEDATKSRENIDSYIEKLNMLSDKYKTIGEAYQKFLLKVSQLQAAAVSKNEKELYAGMLESLNKPRDTQNEIANCEIGIYSQYVKMLTILKENHGRWRVTEEGITFDDNAERAGEYIAAQNEVVRLSERQTVLQKEALERAKRSMDKI